MAPSTIEYYDSCANELIERYDKADMSELHTVFDRYIQPGQKVLDLGFGSGRDMLYLKHKGVDIFGIDASEAFVQHFEKQQPSEKKIVFHSILPDITLPKELEHSFDTICSVATWMHLPEEVHPEAIMSMKCFLKDDGIVILSYSCTPRENDPRFFEALVPEQVANLFELSGFRLIEDIYTSDGLGRDEVKWVTQVFSLSKSIIDLSKGK